MPNKTLKCATQPHRSKRSQNGHRHGKQDDERKYEAFVLCRERQIDNQNSEAEKHRRGAAGRKFFQRQASPFIAETLGQNLLAEILHGRDSLARTKSRCSRAIQLSRSEQIVMRNRLWRGGLRN